MLKVAKTALLSEIVLLYVDLKKLACGKMNKGLITKNYAADPEIKLRTKTIWKPFGLTIVFRQRGSYKNLKAISRKT